MRFLFENYEINGYTEYFGGWIVIESFRRLSFLTAITFVRGFFGRTWATFFGFSAALLWYVSVHPSTRWLEPGNGVDGQRERRQRRL